MADDSARRIEVWSSPQADLSTALAMFAEHKRFGAIYAFHPGDAERIVTGVVDALNHDDCEAVVILIDVEVSS